MVIVMILYHGDSDHRYHDHYFQLELLDNHKCGSEMQDYSPDVIPKVDFHHDNNDYDNTDDDGDETLIP